MTGVGGGDGGVGFGERVGFAVIQDFFDLACGR